MSVRRADLPPPTGSTPELRNRRSRGARATSNAVSESSRSSSSIGLRRPRCCFGCHRLSRALLLARDCGMMRAGGGRIPTAQARSRHGRADRVACRSSEADAVSSDSPSRSARSSSVGGSSTRSLRFCAVDSSCEFAAGSGCCGRLRYFEIDSPGRMIGVYPAGGP